MTGKNFPLLIQIMMLTSQPIVPQSFLEPGGLMGLILANIVSTLVIKCNSIHTVKILLLIQVFIGTQMDLVEILIL